MAATSATPGIRGTIIEAENKASVDATRPLPLVCGLYAIDSGDGVWLCAYYGMNRGNFDYLPQKGAAVDETTLGVSFAIKEFVTKADYQPARWDEFKKKRMLAYGAHGE